MYDKMFDYVKNYLENHDVEMSKVDNFPFRNRYEHIKRVFMWASRLADEFEDSKFNKNAILTAAIFHDVGYAATAKVEGHAEKGAAIFGEYAAEYGYDRDDFDFVSFLIRNHSDKESMFKDGTLLELIVLMEADLLDETGALAIVWDCMSEGGKKEQSFSKTLSHINKYSGKLHKTNPMFTDKAKELWHEKQMLVSEFIRQLEYDLC